MSQALLTTRNLYVERGGRRLIEDLNLSVGPGDMVQVEGDNGSGKTSLLRVLAGLSSYGFEGEITSMGQSIFKDRSAYNHRLLYLGHKPGVKGLLSPRENLSWLYGADVAGSAIDDALSRVGLYGYEDVLCHRLSAGQQRRVGLARLYLSSAPLWLLDEPFTSIDHKGVAQLQEHFLCHVQKGGALVLTSHQALIVDYPLRKVSLS